MTNKNDLFLKLLKQIRFPDSFEDNDILEKGEIENVDVYAKEHKWDIHVLFDTPLKFETYTNLKKAIIENFHDFVNVALFVKTKDGADTYLPEYWQYLLQNSPSLQAVTREFLLKQQPEKNSGRWIIPVDNSVVDGLIEQKALDQLAMEARDLGFFNLKFITKVDQAVDDNNLLSLQQLQEEHERNMQQVFEATPDKPQPKPQPKQYPTRRKNYGNEKIADDATITQIKELEDGMHNVVIEGNIFNIEKRELKSGSVIFTGEITDYSDSIAFKKFASNQEQIEKLSEIKAGTWAKMQGSVQDDQWEHDLVLNLNAIETIEHVGRQESYQGEQKRVELHLHTNMSQLDATNTATDFVKAAKNFGQTAIAITDHGTLQAFPEAHNAANGKDIKILYGVEANLVDDGIPIAYNEVHRNLKETTYVIFDTETTGLSARYDKVIELAAVKMQGGTVIDRFDEFIDPGHPLSQTTINLTSITDEMVRGSKTEEEVFRMFKDFCRDAVIVGHNATFDVDFMNVGYQRHGMDPITEPWIDTLPLARFLYPEMRGFRLNTLAKKLNVTLEHHHRAIYDAEATGYIYYAMLKDAETRFEIQYHDQFNEHIGENDAYKHEHPSHAIILAQTQAGLKNLFKLASESMVNYFYRVPRIPRSLLQKYREGLLVGSACAEGEVFTAMMQKGYQDAKEKAAFYDYLEVQPKALYQPLIEQELVRDEHNLEEIIANMVELGHELGKPVVATGDVHFMNKEDSIYREVLINSQGGANPLNRLRQLPDAHFRTTDEMLADFAFLGQETAQEIVIDNPNKVADMVDEISPVKDKLYTPKMEGAEDNIRNLTMNTAHEWYGDPLPEIVDQRLQKELKSIIGNGFSVIYLISQMLVFKSNKDGYLVGSRGSVGSSLVATMTGITEVNPLPPHYRCPECKWSHFYVKGEYGSGYDLPDKDCSKCGAHLIKDGQDIPFETFLGFKGNKVPDIDLNFSGDYQPIAHNYTKVLFGENNVFRAGTIGTIADKTAYGYVKAYERDKGLHLRNAEIDRLAKGTTGVKRTTGQHPAGILVVPDYMDIYDFTPIQYPADDQTAAWKTTHFDFHSIHDNILKLDILGHDDPTMIRMLQDLSGIDPKTIPMDDPGVMKLFSGTDVLGVTPEQIQSKTGTLGVPEFGTRFVREMLDQTHPDTFASLLKISGLSHGTDVWLGNAQDLIKNGTVTIENVIGCRDDIMMDLIHYGMPNDLSFKIMEHVRKGRGIPDDWQEEMKKNVPDWYIDACLKIKYMFPKAHATAYIMMALRIAYFKVYFPIVYYAAYFSVRADDFDLVAMSRGKEAVKEAMKEINDKGNDASAKEKNLLTVLELANEMLERGFSFKMVDLDKSDAADWLIDGKNLIAPFSAIPGLGLNVAKQIVAAREEKPFLSKEDLAQRGKVSQTLIDFMDANNVLADLPDANQLSLF